MYLSRYLVVGQKNPYGKSSARLTSKSPALQAHEIAIKLSINIPDEMFKKPTLTATFDIPKDSIKPTEISQIQIDSIQEAVTKELGVSLDINLVNTGEK